MTPAITVAGLTKSYLGTTVLHSVDLSIPASRLTVMTGPSGSGKTTLLNLIATLDSPDTGQIHVGDVDVLAMKGKERDRYRASNGHVFQRSGLLGGLTVRENITAAHTIAGKSIDDNLMRSLLRRLTIDDIIDRPATLISGGQAQRVALVRALVHRPAILFADEPTASLDTRSKHDIHALIREVVHEHGTTVVMVSHDSISDEYADNKIAMSDGTIATPQLIPARPATRRNRFRKVER